MRTVGELVQEAVDLNERALSEGAFSAACAAVRETLVKTTGNPEPTLAELKEFLHTHWDLIAFLSFPTAKSPLLNHRVVIKELSLNPRRQYTLQEVVVYLLSHTVKNSGLPAGFGFVRGHEFRMSNGNLLIPVSLTSGLLAFAVVHPANTDESIPDKYWVSLADFKMFASELWGRIDLAERVRKFYLT